MILISGGSGILGTILTRRLLAGGEAVRVMTRSPARAAPLGEAGADVVEGDLLDRDSVVRACEGVQAVVAAAHAGLGRGRNASVHVDDAGHRRLIDTAKASGVGHFVHVSVYDYGPSFRAVPFFRIKYDVEQYLRASGLSYTILRPTAFMDFHAHTLIGEPILRNGRVVWFGRGEQPRNLVAAQDVAQFVIFALRDASLAGETVDVGGPEDLTNMDVVRLYERMSGRHARVVRLPLGVARTMSALLRPVHPGLSQVLQAAVVGETTDQRFDARPLLARFPIELTRLETWISRRLGQGNLAGTDAAAR
jgi:uncharacterized protein YbjT (DUF2867 family)